MKLIIKDSTIAKTRRVDSSVLTFREKRNLPRGAEFECKLIAEGGANHWLVEFQEFPGKWFVYKPHVKAIFDNLITYKHFRACLPYARSEDIDLFFDPLNRAFQEFDVNTVSRLAAFIAQVAHESGSLKWKEEIASGAAYERRRDLGNIYRGDGRRFKGRGVIQLTGRSNYQWASRALGIDLVSNPLKATEPIISSRIACLYWQSRNLNRYADQETIAGFRAITRRINGGYNGWTDRLKHWRIARKALFLKSI
ncbi:putative chitinase [Xenococcus sp. PCC 7305]|uniref:glycoside hydrolase family 19 protein n=1 Tax=Xenococcus sp. PCC 7305 TaxID=102125 RepID=UPI0002ABE5E8|nr:glycoside hydrolase family 19 protein [Xenococcus sp. PCC 7305]ELS04933.1 putative chitinase [Xenococcus sp. PCC 7305]